MHSNDEACRANLRLYWLENTRTIRTGFTIAFIVISIDQLLTWTVGGFASFLYMYLVILLCGFSVLFKGPKMKGYLRWTITFIFFSWGILIALFGKSFGTGLSIDLLKSTFIVWSIFASILVIFIFRIWQDRKPLRVSILYPAITLVMGVSLSLVEEQIFKQIYIDGTDPRPRWTVNSSWLAYDEVAGELRGGD